MFTETAALYDLVYGQFKDYATEAEQIAALLRRLHPAARTLLDVGCGTGEHARLLSERFGYEVAGVDLSPDFVAIARGKVPAGSFVQADMAEFSLGRRFDAILCLFSSIGYARTADRAARTLRRFAEHLANGGVVIVEPWFEPGVLEEGRVAINTAETPQVKVCRMGHTSVQDRLSTIDLQYLIGARDGIRYARERHELGLFTAAEMTGFFEQAGFTVEHDPRGLTGRGLYIGRRAHERDDRPARA